MPLPPALAARLAKRGILKPNNSETNNDISTVPANEEIIAEDYDSKPEDSNRNEVFWGGIEGINVDPIKGHKGCPNKSNIYHECSTYCVKKWKLGKVVPDHVYLENKRKALEIWPLPPGWEEVYDEGCGQHYFWNVHNNLVSWYPPAHPCAPAPTESAAHLREERVLKEGDESDDSSEASDQEVPQQPLKEKRYHRQQREKGVVHHRDRKKPRVRDNDLDPMDPASYSDIPRGSWTAGLDNHAKTGVDTTASGSLYQMRPYPAPGAILAANAKHNSQDDVPSP